MGLNLKRILGVDGIELEDMLYPRMVKIRQQLDGSVVPDIALAVKAEFWKSRLSSEMKPGSKVAITAGSRGITDIVAIISSLVREVKSKGGDPFIVPAMGSHGGATAEGQLQILSDYGIKEDIVGCPIISSMEVIKVGETRSGIPVLLDRNACRADHIIVLNRVKSHTEFHGQIESGLMKMIVIGLGKHEGTIIAHRFAVKYGYERTITEIGLCALEKAPLALGIAIIENGYGRTAQITAVEPENFLETEKKLLSIARIKTPKIPFDKFDVLIVDECGKEISGTGMDTKVLGRIMNIYEEELNHPNITRVILRDLTEKTHGNAIGIGLADFITRKVVGKIDYRATYINSITAITPEKARLPLICENDKEAVDFAIATAGPVDFESVKIVWINHTSKLDEMWISKGLLHEVTEKENLKIIGNEHEMKFDDYGNLIEN
jgi:hypothetical protein